MIQSHKQTKTVTEVTEVTTEHALLGRHNATNRDLHGVRVKTTIQRTDGEGKVTTKSTLKHGIVDDEGLALAINNGTVQPALTPRPSKYDDKGFSSFWMVTPEFPQLWAQNGRYVDFKDSDNQHNQCIIKDILGYAESGKPYLLVDWYGGNGQVYDMDGQMYSQPIRFDYIEAQMDNGSYDLELAVEILKQRSDVELLPDGGENSYRRKEDPVCHIGYIPGYNAEEDREYCIAFYLRLPQEDYARLLGTAETTSEKIRKIIDCDYLGLIAGGAAKWGNALGRYNNKRNPAYKGKEPYAKNNDYCGCNDDEGDDY